MSKKIAQDMFRKYQILYLFATADVQLTVADIQARTGIAYSTLTRQRAKLRDEFGMTIEFVRWKGLVGTNGYLKVSDWGVFDKDRLVEFCETTVFRDRTVDGKPKRGSRA